MSTGQTVLDRDAAKNAVQQQTSEMRTPIRNISRQRHTVILQFTGNRRAVVGIVILALLTAVALLAPVIATHDPEASDMAVRYQAPSAAHLMGTDAFGRDVFSRAVFASRVTLTIAVVSVAIAIVLSVIVGVLAGYYGGLVDQVLLRVTEVLLAIPSLLFAITIVGAFGPSVPLLILLLGLTAWPVGARIVRGEVLALRAREFVLAARAVGAPDTRIVLRHLIPNFLSVVIVSATIRVAVNILVEASLSFLGLGVPPPLASWGNMVADGKTALRTAWWVSAFPGALIFMTVMAFNLVGDGLRDAFDPHMKQ